MPLEMARSDALAVGALRQMARVLPSWWSLGPPLATPLLRYPAAVPLVVTCVQCREEVLEADVIGDQEECLLRDHLLAVHPNTIQPETRRVLLTHFVVSEQPPPAA